MRKTTVSGECLLWTGAVGSHGYGNAYLKGRYVTAHKAFYSLEVGPVPSGLELMHSCDNKLCVNIKHLTPGTGLQNTRDAFARGLVRARPTGERHHLSKISNAEVQQILDLRGVLTYEQIATAYGVATRTIAGICQGTARCKDGQS